MQLFKYEQAFNKICFQPESGYLTKIRTSVKGREFKYGRNLANFKSQESYFQKNGTKDVRKNKQRE